MNCITNQVFFFAFTAFVQCFYNSPHRFAIEFHRSLRSKEQVHSLLDDIPGIGETRRKALMRKFKSIENIRDASLEELTETESMNAGSAQKVYEFFHGASVPTS